MFDLDLNAPEGVRTLASETELAIMVLTTRFGLDGGGLASRLWGRFQTRAAA